MTVNAGLKVWDEKGQLTFDGTSRPVKVLGSFNVSVSGKRSVELPDDNAIIFAFALNNIGRPYPGYYAPHVYAKDKTIFYTYNSQWRIPVTIFWGIY